MTLRVACVQLAPVKAETERNLDAIAEHATQAISEGASLIVFPEAATSGYFLEGGVTQVALAPKELHDMLSHRLQNWPEETGIVVGHYERADDGEIYNSATLLLRGGVATTHRKLFLPTYGVFDEERFISRGSNLTCTRFSGIPTSILICEDVWHAITPTLAAMQGASLMLIPSASPARGFEGLQVGNHAMYRRICESISGEHGVFAINSQLVGFEGGKGFVGGSVITNPFGEVIAEGPVGKEAIVVADLDLDLVGIARSQSPLLSDKRTMWPRLMKIAAGLG